LLKKSDVGLDHWPGQANGVNRISEGHATALHDVRNNKSGRAGTARRTMYIYYLQLTSKSAKKPKAAVTYLTISVGVLKKREGRLKGSSDALFRFV